VVVGSPKIRRGAACRVRHGHRARGGLDLRVRARAGDNTVREDTAPVVSVKLSMAIAECRLKGIPAFQIGNRQFENRKFL
jgi:hypothetical protein